MDNIDNLLEKEPIIDEKVLYDDVIKCFDEIIECFHDAIKCFYKAITLNPNDNASYFCRAYSKCELQDYAGAIEDCCKSIEINPNNLHVYEKCIEAYK